MKSYLLKLLIALVVGSFLTSPTSGQKTSVYDRQTESWRTALELLNKEKYGSAREWFRKIIESDQQASVMSSYAEYYASICALKLFHSDAEDLSLGFILRNPEHPKVNSAWFETATYQFRNKSWGRSLTAWEMVDVKLLSTAEQAEYHFKKGYCYFYAEEYDKAKAEFNEVKDGDSKYFAPANYYFGHIAYDQKNYETAIKHFRRLTGDSNYGKIVPYYITQIYYLQEKYAELLEVAPALLDSASSKRAPEIARMIGDAHFRLGEYAAAIPYLELYMQKTSAIFTRDDNYQLGFAYYKTSQFKDAITFFNKVKTAQNDSLSQATWYHLADCYLSTGDKTFAMNCFKEAGNSDFDSEIQENSLFNYAKLTYENEFNPYNEAITAFDNYIWKYPSSTHLDESYEYLSNLYISTRNYKDALKSIESIKQKTPRLNQAYQKIAYFRGIELFNNGDFLGAIENFIKGINTGYDPSYTALCFYWRGEANYRLEKYIDALDDYTVFIKYPAAFGTPEYSQADYNIGYCNFKKQKYPEATTAFRRFLSNSKNEKPLIVCDANMRTGDGLFMARDFEGAIEYYNRAINLKLVDTDYGLFQKSLALGALAKFDEKATTLQKLVTEYKTSIYYDDAMYELGNTSQHLGDAVKAIEYYDRLIRDYPSSSYISRALLKKGLIQYNQNKDEDALITLKQVVSRYPGTPESKEALVSIKNIYVAIDKVEEFFSYIKDLPFANVSDNEQDSITYMAAENRYMEGNCAASTKGFRDYLTKFPNGIFQTDATFYLAECLYQAGNLDEALVNYSFINEKLKCQFTESALLKSAEISFIKKYYDKALPLYERLESNAEYKSNVTIALVGQMRCLYWLEKYSACISATSKVLAIDKLAEELQTEAHLLVARSAFSIDSLGLAQVEYNTVIKLTNSEMGAEARYGIASIYNKLGQYEASEKAAFDIINQVPSYDYWVAKSFILLADNYALMGNLRQAKLTLQSIIENYEGADLVKEAQDKLKAITDAERLEEQRKLQEQNDQENQGNDNNTNFDEK